MKQSVEQIENRGGAGRAARLGLFIITAAVSMVVVLGVRWFEYPSWNHPALMVAGERIQGTQDAYAWLAGAKGVGMWDEAAFSHIAVAASKVAGAALDQVGFLLPPLAAALVSAVVVLWAWTLGYTEFAFCAGVMAGLAPGFYLRTRFGYFDTDLVTLLLPLAFTWAGAQWLKPWLHADWKEAWRSLRRGGADQPHDGDCPNALWMLALGAAAWWVSPLHHHMHAFVTGLPCLMFLLAVTLGRPGVRMHLVLGAALFGVASTAPLVGAALGVLLYLAMPPRPVSRHTVLRYYGIPLATVLAATTLRLVLVGSFERSVGGIIFNYAKPLVSGVPDKAPEVSGVSDQVVDQETLMTFPSIYQSMAEADNLGVVELLHHQHPWAWLGLAGLLGMALILWRRPLAVLLLPFLAVGVASVSYGARMSMFAGPVSALGLVGMLTMALQWRGLSKVRSRTGLVVCNIMLATLLAWPMASIATRLQPTPVLSRQHAQGLIALKEIAPEDAVIWNWWDFGYATSYYAERNVFAHGGRQDGRYAYALAKAYCTSNPKLSHQLISHCIGESGPPLRELEKVSAAETMEFLKELGGRDGRETPHPARPVYVVVSCEFLEVFPWISYYGSWDPEVMEGSHWDIKLFPPDIPLELNHGAMQTPKGPVPIRSFESFSPKGGVHRSYSHQSGPHVLFFPELEKLYTVCEKTYNSIALRLLLEDPTSAGFKESFGGLFQLVVEGYPFVRVYEVVHSLSVATQATE